MSGRMRSRKGTAPMWSSWPWVRTIASTSASRSAMWEKSGRIRSTPGWDSSGNSTPQSMTSSRPSISRTAMLRPISPIPPSATIRSDAGLKRGRRGQLGVTRPHAAKPGTPAVARSARSVATCSGVASTSGSRTGPAGRPRSRRAALVRIDALGPEHPDVRGDHRGVQLASPAATSPVRCAAIISPHAARSGRARPRTPRRRRRPTAAAASARRRRSTRPGRSSRSPPRQLATSPFASLLATIRGCSAIRAKVSGSIGTPGPPRDVVGHDRQVGGCPRSPGSAPRCPPAAACCSTA